MAKDFSNNAVLLMVVFLLVISVVGTWVMLTQTTTTETLDAEQGVIRLQIHQAPSESVAGGQVKVNIVKGG